MLHPDNIGEYTQVSYFYISVCMLSVDRMSVRLIIKDICKTLETTQNILAHTSAEEHLRVGAILWKFIKQETEWILNMLQSVEK